MKKWAYYNDIDECACHVTKELMSAGLIAPGVVDCRSIKEVTADDVREFAQAHWFCGMSGWSVAARLAGWPDGRPLWSASCPCQPFSAAGRGLGEDDPRHLWPDLFRIVSGARERGFGPDCIVGEQVSGAAGYGWFDGVRADLASQGFACGTRDIPACAIDAPHQRNRLYWIALGDCAASAAWQSGLGDRQEPPRRSNGHVALGDGLGSGLERHAGHGNGSGRPLAARPVAAPDGRNGDGLHADADQSFGWIGNQQPAGQLPIDELHVGSRVRPGSRNGSFYADAGWIVCHDGKARRAKPGVRLLADGMVGRIDLWRLAGNGIVLPLAAEVIAALMDVLPEWRAAA